jgi:uncharacterized sulfatase
MRRANEVEDPTCQKAREQSRFAGQRLDPLAISQLETGQSWTGANPDSHLFSLRMLRYLVPVIAFLAIAFGATAAEKPNIILFFTDDHGWPDIGAAGVNDDLKTPHLDALAASGVHATNGYVTAPQCVPSRGGLLTGRFQSRFGLESNRDSLKGFDEQSTIAERLKAVGYATGQIGKWHLGPMNEITQHGFDDVYAKNANRPCFANYTLAGKTIEMQQVDDGLYHLDACSQAALTFIERHAEEPFFLYLAYRAPHVPLDAPEKYLSRFPGKMPERRRQALAMISAMDDGVGAIIADLKARDLDKNTLIFFIGDNGAPLKIHKIDAPGGGPGWDGSLNEPMNGEKGMLSEGGIRVPFLISWPGTIPGGQVYDQPIVSLDVAATAVELAGQERDETLDGVNLVPFLKGQKKGAPHEVLTWRWVAQAAIREGKWKLLVGGQREYLFDIVADPREKQNVLSKNPEVTKRLRSKLESWSNELQPRGLEARGMAITWKKYFDHYLDGKKQPRPKKTSKEAHPKTHQDWVPRNAKVTQTDGGLRVLPAKKGRPFLTKIDFEWTGGFTAQVRLKGAKNGNTGIAWRSQGQKSFSSDQIVQVPFKGGAKMQTLEIEVPAQGKVVHLRLHLPDGETTLEEVNVTQGEKAVSWSFKNPQ